MQCWKNSQVWVIAVSLFSQFSQTIWVILYLKKGKSLGGEKPVHILRKGEFKFETLTNFIKNPLNIVLLHIVSEN